MTNKNTSEGFEFVFDPTLEDPASYNDEIPEDTPGPFLPNIEGRTEFLPPDPDRIPVIENAIDRYSEAYAARPAKKRTRELFSQMHAQRPILKRIIASASEPITTSQIEEAVKTMKEQRFSIYSTANLCSMLEQAGALKCVDASGQPYERKTGEPNIVVVDGEAYYEPSSAPERYWLATEDGKSVASDKDSKERLERILEKEENLLSIHKRVLEMCSEEDGARVASMSAAIDSNPLIADPRRFFVQHFIEELEAAGALLWSGKSWMTTDIGQEFLAQLADVKDDYVAPETEDKFSVATETDGVRW